MKPEIKQDLLIGIDPGTHTGYAELDIATGELAVVSTHKLHHVLDMIKDRWADKRIHTVFWEDAHKRQYLGNKGREALQGAGSIKRDCSIFREFFEDHGIPNQAIAPQAGMTKWDAERFAKLTGWQGRTSQHARDAAVLLLGRRVR